jgi:hypothetical protein
LWISGILLKPGQTVKMYMSFSDKDLKPSH